MAIADHSTKNLVNRISLTFSRRSALRRKFYTMTEVGVLLFVLLACTGKDNIESKTPQEALNAFAQELEVRYVHLGNEGATKCESEGVSSPCFFVEYQFTSKYHRSADDISVYFSDVSLLKKSLNPNWSVTHVNGDLYQLKASQAQSFVPGEKIVLPMIFDGYSVTEGKHMPNMFIVQEGLEPAIISSSQEKYDPQMGLHRPHFVEAYTNRRTQWRRGEADQTPLADNAYRIARRASLNKVDQPSQTRIIPKPLQIQSLREDKIYLARGLRLAEVPSGFSLTPFMEQLSLLGLSLQDEGIPLSLAIVSPQKGVKSESYTLNTSATGIRLEASEESGLFYGLQTLLALINPEDYSLPQVEIHDRPRFEFRGMHVDVARNFQSSADLKKLIVQMARYKLNKLHLHLADDEGWRLEINGLPELTDIGGYRCFDFSEQQCLLPQLGSGPFKSSAVNGYYSAREYVGLLQFADAHFVEIIPSLDMPGHARAAIVSMKARENQLMKQGLKEEAARFRLHDPDDKTQYLSIQYYTDNTINPCIESSYAFIDKVVEEVKTLHAAAGVPLQSFHVGADETGGAWLDSPACAKRVSTLQGSEEEKRHQLSAYFLTRVSQLLREKSLQMGGWSDGMQTFNSPTQAPMHVNVWNTTFGGAFTTARDFADNGHEVILSLPDVSYFDFPWEAHPSEPGYYWASRQTDLMKVFAFMPENLPALAEIYTDTLGNPFTSDDRKNSSDTEKMNSQHGKGAHIHGIQAQLWSETVRNSERFHYMVFPRLLAHADRAWHRADWELPYNKNGTLYHAGSGHFSQSDRSQREADFSEFLTRISTYELAALSRNNVPFRMPLVLAEQREGKWVLSSEYGALPIQYRKPQEEWQTYVEPLDWQGALEMRTYLPTEQRFGRVTAVP